MGIRSELNNLKETDVWSLLLFVLYKMKDTPEFSSLSELAYILDKKSLLKLFEYFGGTTITIPTIDEFERLIYGLLLYEYVDIQKEDFEVALNKIKSSNVGRVDIKHYYKKVKETMNSYNISRRGDDS
jgi:hypothetical protein